MDCPSVAPGQGYDGSMKKLIREACEGGLAALLVFALALIPSVASAFTFQSGEQLSTPADVTISDDVYLFGGSVVSGSTVEGDAFVFGGNVLVNGSVGSDIAAAGGAVIILGNVADDVRAAGGNVVVQGSVGDDVVVGGGQVTLAGASIGGDVVIAGGVVTITAPIQGDLKIGGGEVILNGPVAGNVVINAEKVTLGESAVLGGTLTYSAMEEATIAENATIAGEVLYSEYQGRNDIDKEALAVGLAAFVSIWLLMKFLMLLLGALLLGLFLRRFARELVDGAMERPWAELGRGLVFVIVTPVVSVILMTTLIGIPLGFIGLAVLTLASLVASFGAAIITGSALHKWIAKPAEAQVNWQTILLGAVAYEVLGLIPIIGWIVKCAIFLIAIGVLWKTRWAEIASWR